MALIKCPECGKDVSTFAKTCPNCGYPLKKENTEKEEKAKIDKEEQKKTDFSNYSSFNVIYKDYGDSSSFSYFEFAKITGLSLRDAMDMRYECPIAVLENVSYEKATSVAEKLRETGAEIEVVPNDGRKIDTIPRCPRCGEPNGNWKEKFINCQYCGQLLIEPEDKSKTYCLHLENSQHDKKDEFTKILKKDPYVKKEWKKYADWGTLFLHELPYEVAIAKLKEFMKYKPSNLKEKDDFFIRIYDDEERLKQIKEEFSSSSYTETKVEEKPANTCINCAYVRKNYNGYFCSNQNNAVVKGIIDRKLDYRDVSENDTCGFFVEKVKQSN